MNTIQWNAFYSFREEFKKQCKLWAQQSQTLIPLIKQAALKDTPDYPVQTPVVYNTALDSFTKDSDIKLIVIADNPGKNEQLASNQKYLIGQAGKLAEGFFNKNPCLKIDFRKNTIILNKTPVHSAKTAHLNTICSSGPQQIRDLILESQLWMAEHTATLHQILFLGQDKSQKYSTQLWMTGYGELKNKGIFLPYKNTFFNTYLTDKGLSKAWQEVYVYQHFSMNCFSKDLNKFIQEETGPLAQSLKFLGSRHKNEIFTENYSSTTSASS